jgi:PIN domain nuclease of toxin-antitoxin system
MPNVPGEKLLIDTHVWLWWATGNVRLKGTKALRAMEASASRDQVFLSAISLWEVGMLSAKGRIQLYPSVRQWIDRALTETSVQIAPLTARGALAAALLPGEFHGDPADRILMATAEETSATLVTADTRILRYCAHRHSAVLKV